jgi:hypothetical protein
MIVFYQRKRVEFSKGCEEKTMYERETFICLFVFLVHLLNFYSNG